ncbi:hypothetical protein [Yoonia sp. 2307UL14-13]|uniref:hypothetical protein n=1 Tax=Yoonia sp. 2307UL14-13 TaxID=3126506 RepID=UPI00309E2BC8
MRYFEKLAMVFALVGTPAAPDPWHEVIPKVAERADFLIAEAHRRGFERISVRMRDEITWHAFYRDSHECGILGRMLGVPELVADYEKIEEPDITNEMRGADILRLHGVGRTYAAWVSQAEWYAKQNLSDKVDTWNSICANWDTIRYAPKFIITTGPSYADFPTLNYLPDDHPVIEIDSQGMSDWEIERFLPIIQAGLERGPNFAGRYSIVALSCGTSCRLYDITDTGTGEGITAPFGGEETTELNVDFNVNSQLIYVTHLGGKVDECVLRAWHFDGTEFVLKHEQVFAREDVGCNIGNFRVIRG